MRWAGIAAVAVLLVAPKTGRAQELNFSVQSRVGYDSNIFSVDDRTESAVLSLRPAGEIKDHLESGSYRLRYEPSLYVYARKNGTDAINHRVIGEATYVLSPRTEITAYDRFLHQENIQLDEGAADPDDLGGEKRITTLNHTTLLLTHELTQRLKLTAQAADTVFRYENSDSEDSDFLSGFAQLTYSFTPRTSGGFGGSAGYRIFDEIAPLPATALFCPNERGPGTRTVNYQGFATVSHAFDQTMRIQLQAGPARVESDSYACALPPGADPLITPPASYFFQRFENNQTTWFAQGDLTKAWQHFDVLLRYERREGLAGSSANSAASVNDQMYVQAQWKPSRLWGLRARAEWIRRDTSFARGPDRQLTTWTGYFSATRQLTRRSSLTLDASYREQTGSGREGIATITNDVREYNAFRVNLGYEYRFAPVRF